MVFIFTNLLNSPNQSGHHFKLFLSKLSFCKLTKWSNAFSSMSSILLCDKESSSELLKLVKSACWMCPRRLLSKKKRVNWLFRTKKSRNDVNSLLDNSSKEMYSQSFKTPLKSNFCYRDSDEPIHFAEAERFQIKWFWSL